MPIRLIPDLLTQGDREMRLPRRHGFAHIIGKGFPEISPKPLPTTHDASSAHEIAFREWWRMWRRGGSDDLRPPLPARPQSGMIAPMTKPIHTRTFQSGDGVAVRLPESFAIPADAEVVLEKAGDGVVIRLARDEAEATRRLHEWLDMLQALPKPPAVETREPIEFPDRPGG